MKDGNNLIKILSGLRDKFITILMKGNAH